VCGLSFTSSSAEGVLRRATNHLRQSSNESFTFGLGSVSATITVGSAAWSHGGWPSHPWRGEPRGRPRQVPGFSFLCRAFDRIGTQRVRFAPAALMLQLVRHLTAVLRELPHNLRALRALDEEARRSRRVSGGPRVPERSRKISGVGTRMRGADIRTRASIVVSFIRIAKSIEPRAGAIILDLVRPAAQAL
jgi:hypothetical protein